MTVPRSQPGARATEHPSSPSRRATLATSLLCTPIRPSPPGTKGSGPEEHLSASRSRSTSSGSVPASASGWPTSAPVTVLEVGWTLRSAYLGRGLATEIGWAGLRFAFGELAVAEVVAFSAVHHQRSRAVMHRLQMTYQGEFPHRGVNEASGRVEEAAPFALYAITADAFAAAPWAGGGRSRMTGGAGRAGASWAAGGAQRFEDHRRAQTGPAPRRCGEATRVQLRTLRSPSRAMDRPLHLPVTLVLAGTSQYQDVVTTAVAGQRVEVRHEPDNPEDQNACVATTIEGETLGYVPRGLAPRLLATGSARFVGKIAELRIGRTWGLAVEVLSACDDAPPRMPGPLAGAELAARDGVEGLAEARSDAAIVFAKSGRELGVFVRLEGAKVVVRQASGREITFPDELVRIGVPA